MGRVSFQQRQLCEADGTRTGVFIESRVVYDDEATEISDFGINAGNLWVYADEATVQEKREMILRLISEAAAAGRHLAVAERATLLAECDERIAKAIYDRDMFEVAMRAVGEMP